MQERSASGADARWIAVTGANGGIGRATCRRLVQEGYAVLAIDRDPDVQSLDADYCRAHAVSNLSDLEGGRSALASAEGELAGLVHLAGTMLADPQLGSEMEVWRQMLADNLDSAFLLATTAAELMPVGGAGRMVFASSLAYRRGAVDHVGYSAAKAGLVGLTRSLARRFADRAIVNALAPGIINTAMPREVIAKRRDALLEEIILRRFGEPEEVAGVIAFLCGPDAGYITGQTINIDGGMIFS